MNYIARFSANSDFGGQLTGSWSSLNTGLTPHMKTSEIVIGGLTLTSWAEGLVVGGAFIEAGGVLTGPIAYWSIVNNNWQALKNPCGTGCPELWNIRKLTQCPSNCCPDDLMYEVSPRAWVASVKSNGGFLYAVVFNSEDFYSRGGVLVRWDGTSWTEITPRIPDIGTFLGSMRPGHLLAGNATNDAIVNLGSSTKWATLTTVPRNFVAWNSDNQNSVDPQFNAEEYVFVVKNRFVPDTFSGAGALGGVMLDLLWGLW